MSVRDSSFTSPDAIRRLYLSPKNPLRSLEDATEAAQTQTVAQIVNTPTGQTGGGYTGGGYGGGGSPSGCPAATDFVLSANAKTGQIVPKLAALLVAGADYLYNPITKTAHRIGFLEIIEEVECVRVETTSGASQIASYTHPVIRNYRDETGESVEDLLKSADSNHGAVSYINFDLAQTDINLIEEAARRTVVKISLESGYIYASGTNPTAMILGHNNKSSGGGAILEQNQQ